MTLIRTVDVTECCRGLIWGAGGAMFDSWLGHLYTSPNCPILDMNLTKSFPPADALIDILQEVDYKKHFNTFMDAVVIACAFVAAIATVIRDKWIEHDCTERLQIFVLRVIELVKTFYAWMTNVFVPECKSFYDECRSIYNVLRTI